MLLRFQLVSLSLICMSNDAGANAGFLDHGRCARRSARRSSAGRHQSGRKGATAERPAPAFAALSEIVSIDLARRLAVSPGRRDASGYPEFPAPA